MGGRILMGAWQLDPQSTRVDFSTRHLGVITVRGHFSEVSTTADIDPDHPDVSSVQAIIRSASIRTHNEARDNDIRLTFLEVNKFPIISFESTAVEKLAEDRYSLKGNLTVKGNTNSVTLELVILGEANDPLMGHRIAYRASGKISRTDFGLNFNLVLDGKFVISDEVQINIEGELVEQEETA
jgi:polyisoprenoid-binding protein YceI